MIVNAEALEPHQSGKANRVLLRLRLHSIALGATLLIRGPERISLS